MCMKVKGSGSVPQKEVTQVDEFAVMLVFDVDNTPAVLATPDLLSVDHNGTIRANDGKRNDFLDIMSICLGGWGFGNNTLMVWFNSISSSSCSSESKG